MKTREVISEKKREIKQQVVAMDALTCPITLELFVDPVIAQDGHTYEKAAIQKWLDGNNRSPLTLKLLPGKKLLVNWAIKKAIDELKTLNEASSTIQKINEDHLVKIQSLEKEKKEDLERISNLEKKVEKHVKTIRDLKQKNQELEKAEKQHQIDTPQPSGGSFLDFFSRPDVCSGEKKEVSHCCIL